MPALLPLLLTAKGWLAKLPWKPILIALSAVALLAATFHQGKVRGIEETTATYEKAEAEAKDKAEKLKLQRDTDAAQAVKKDVVDTTKTLIRYIPVEKKVTVYVKTPAAAAPCFDDAGFVLAQESVDTANASLAAAARKSD